MKVEQIKKVMKKYRMAWEKGDIDLILDCFTKNGMYQDTPLIKPFKGHKEIRRYWDFYVIKNVKDVNFKLGKCYVSKDGQTGFAEWVCENTYRSPKDNKWRKGKMVGIMILKMKGSRITHLNEYYNSTRNERGRLK